MELSRYLKVYSHPDKTGRLVLVATRRCAVLELSGTLWDRVRNNGELSQRELDVLEAKGVLVEDNEIEREEMRTLFQNLNCNNNVYTLLVTLTLDCTLACPYCFEDPFRGHFVMSEDTAVLLMQRVIEQMAAGRDVLMDFYGGEALMALPMLKRIALRLSDEAQSHGVRFDFNIITNGTLLSRQVVEELLPLGLAAVRVTIDGPRDIHDRQRPFASGKGSFDTIVANVRDIYEMVPVDIGSNYAKENYQRFPELLDYLIGEGIDPKKLKAMVFAPVMPKADGSMGGDFSHVCASTSEPWMIEAGLFLRGETIRRGFPVPKLASGACMIEFSNDLVIAYDGSIYKCPVLMGEEQFKVGTLAEGISDYSRSHNLDVWKNDECLDCAYLPLCFGGCRFMRKLRTGAIDGVDCRRDLLDATLERIVLQDLGM
jgi:uncharacterized protein